MGPSEDGPPVGYENAAFDGGNDDFKARASNAASTGGKDHLPQKPKWKNSIEFLMSCVALSVGFGNIWRFPFTAYENGGGAFLIPYVILLFLVGKPFYYLESIIGQFSGKSMIKVWKVSPAFTGVGWAQFCSLICLASYYCSIMALTLRYLWASFSLNLPWAQCLTEWGDNCVDSDSTKDDLDDDNSTEAFVRLRSSAELYFTKVVLKETSSIDDGIGIPDWKLTICLFISWGCVCLILYGGVKSAGKASYFLAIFPYIILLGLLVRAVTLDGAVNGILYFVTPRWSKLQDPNVWYAAVTQCFFSLSVCFGSIITYSSHNEFRHNVYRDTMIITSLDTITSMIAGCTIFGILGNLAHEMGIEDVASVARSGTGLAFISYPDAIAKFSILPQLFAVLFFLMLFVLGVGSAVAMVNSIIGAIREEFPKLKPWQVTYPACFVGFLVGLVYVTPGGQFVLTIVDHYGASFVVFVLAAFEMAGLIWVYGLDNFLDDVEFMLDRKVSLYWRLCWFVVTPAILIGIFLYSVASMSTLTYSGIVLPTKAHAAGGVLLAVGVLQIPIWMTVALIKNRHLPFLQMLRTSFKPSPDWGPQEVKLRSEWKSFKEAQALKRKSRNANLIHRLLCFRQSSK